MTGTTAPPIIERAGELLQRYDVLFCDVWGVVHNGHAALPEASDALLRFRKKGGTVILVSNAPVPNHQVASMLDQLRLPRETWDAIVSSGDIALRHVDSQGYGKLYPIGPQDRDAALFAKVAFLSGALKGSEAILCSGLNDDRTETAEDYRDVLSRARDLRLPFVCANPDFVVDVGGRLYLCAGALGDVYEELGGDVFWAGKPHAVAYETALLQAQELRQEVVPRERLLVIGDSVRTDMKGARTFGVDALFIAGGIHREETLARGRIVPERLADLFADGAPGATAAMAHLGW
ncbi:MAG: TIGR01459 family HAD-type hydrolase [Alphaproteobacteria bacterium]|nr:TIGR01459 family HAD-type hydrolase [Alphaproteobacteria bacterium]